MAVFIEQMDAPEAASTSYAMGSGDTFRGSLGTGQSDWIKVTLVAGQSYAFAAMGLGALGSGVVDGRLVLRDAQGRALYGDEDSGPGLSASFTYVPQVGGSFYLDVSSHRSGAGGRYAVSVTSGTMASFGPEAGAGALLREGAAWAPAGQGTVLTWGFRAPGAALDANGDAAPFALLTAAQQGAVYKVLAAYSEVAGVRFQQIAPGGTTTQATLLVGAYTSTTDGAGAFANLPGSRDAGAVDGDVWLNNDSVSTTWLPRGSYAHFAILHEFGHALGLDHPGDYNAGPGQVITYATHAQFFQDSTQYTVMSYFDVWATEPNAPRKKPDTLMMYDILALQKLYGANTAAHAGNSTYGFNSNVGGPYDFKVNKMPLLCIWDGSGIDTIDLSGFGQAQKIDLVAGRFSDVAGYRGNLSIAVGVWIENAVGGMGSDQILGNGLGNRLVGRGGDDTIDGGQGNDTLTGGRGADVFVFDKGEGSDWITDFDNALDMLDLDAALWGGGALSHSEIVARFALLRDGHVVLDFGVQELHLLGLMSVSGVESHLRSDYG